jgi:hypothetical protein
MCTPHRARAPTRSLEAHTRAVVVLVSVLGEFVPVRTGAGGNTRSDTGPAAGNCVQASRGSEGTRDTARHSRACCTRSGKGAKVFFANGWAIAGAKNTPGRCKHLPSRLQLIRM